MPLSRTGVPDQSVALFKVIQGPRPCCAVGLNVICAQLPEEEERAKSGYA